MTEDIPDEEALEEHLENTSAKALLVEQNALLRGIYDALAEPHNKDTESGESETYLCQECNETLPKSDVKAHMQEEHNAPPGIDYLDTPFIEEV